MAIGRVPGQTGIQPSIVTAKGDLIVATASGSVTNQSVGSNNQVLTADSAQSDGIKWANGSAATLTTTGDILYASSANTPARLGIGSTDQVLKVSGGVPVWGAAPAASFVGCSVYKVSGSQSVGAGTAAAVTFNGENFDSDGFHDNSTNNSRLTIPTGQGGKYIVSGRTIWYEYNKGKVASTIRKNGSTALAYSVDYTATDYWETHAIVSIVDLAAGDYIELLVENGGGGSRNIYGDDNAVQATQFSIAKV
jgi:hypothetical protein